jgi:hypothetical protein
VSVEGRPAGRGPDIRNFVSKAAVMLGNRRRSGRLFAQDLTPSVDGRPKVSRRCTTELWPRFSQAQKACLRRLAYFANGLHSRGGGNRARANKIVLKPVDAPATKTKKTQTSRLFSKPLVEKRMFSIYRWKVRCRIASVQSPTSAMR